MYAMNLCSELHFEMNIRNEYPSNDKYVLTLEIIFQQLIAIKWKIKEKLGLT